MPLFSYLAIPRNGAKKRLCAELAVFKYCQVIPADNYDVLVVITDTPDETTEKSLQASLKSLPSLQSLSLAFGYDEQTPQMR